MPVQERFSAGYGHKTDRVFFQQVIEHPRDHRRCHFMAFFFRPYPAMLAMQLAMVGDLDRDVVKERFAHFFLKKARQCSITVSAFSALINEYNGKCKAV